MKSGKFMAGAVLAAGLVSGCSAAPSAESLPHPAPLNASSPAPSFEACGDIDNLQIVAFSAADGSQDARNGEHCAATYKPFTHQRIGTLAAGASFGIMCANAESGAWRILYGPSYGQEAAVYPTSAYRAVFNTLIAGGTANPVPPCGNIPHMPYGS